MDSYRPEMKKFYYDPTKYKTYLEQLGIKYPTVRTRRARPRSRIARLRRLDSGSAPAGSRCARTLEPAVRAAGALLACARSCRNGGGLHQTPPFHVQVVLNEQRRRAKRRRRPCSAGERSECSAHLQRARTGSAAPANLQRA